MGVRRRCFAIICSMNRAYYSRWVSHFIVQDVQSILGELAMEHQFPLTDLQRNSWVSQIEILKEALESFPDGRLLFEYAIPRMGKRIDAVLLLRDIVFAIEFKHNANSFTASAIDQVLDYSLDLKNFHAASHDRAIVPVVLASQASDPGFFFDSFDDHVFKPCCANPTSLPALIDAAINEISRTDLDPVAWEAANYSPTPTIIEAAQSLYKGHGVEEISRSDSGAINLRSTCSTFDEVIDECKVKNQKAICFLTGVPGAGKTLAGLNIANRRHKFDEQEHAVFLSGNGPLVMVLQEALAIDKVESAKAQGQSITKKSARAETKAFIQNIHHFRDDNLRSDAPPIERVVIFDEAQRAWTQRKTELFMRQKKGLADFHMSEPEFLISVLDRHDDWAVIVCLIGGGQEINTGEAGLPEWFRSLRQRFKCWQIYVSSTLNDVEYTQGGELFSDIASGRVIHKSDLHLAVSVRSFRSELMSDFVKQMLDGELAVASTICQKLVASYPVVLTRDIDVAKAWLKSSARGTERFGMVSSSGAYRLRQYGINVKTSIDPTHWFLKGKDDVRSSFFLEDVATEFDIQGLELDWICVAWDANLRYTKSGWQFMRFSGTKWNNINQKSDQLYLLNAYRVLLTRARQGMVIFIPHGDEFDVTRAPEFYDATYQYLKDIGVEELR